MSRNLNVWMMSRRKAVKIHSFSGSIVQELDLFIKPLLARTLHHVIVLIGTNDILDKSMTADTIADRITQIGKRIEDHGIKYIISELVTRNDVSTYNNKVKSVNNKLREITAKTKIGFVEQSNIGYEHLNFGGLHLNKRGDGALALNFIHYIRD